MPTEKEIDATKVCKHNLIEEKAETRLFRCRDCGLNINVDDMFEKFDSLSEHCKWGAKWFPFDGKAIYNTPPVSIRQLFEITANSIDLRRGNAN
jgi:hypothetical protein